MSSNFFFLFFFFLLLFKIRAVLFFFSPFLFTIRALFVLKCPKVPRITRELPQSAPACAPSPKAPSLHARSPRGWGASAAWASRALITIRSGYGASRLGGAFFTIGRNSKLLVRAQVSQSQRHHSVSGGGGGCGGCGAAVDRSDTDTSVALAARTACGAAEFCRVVVVQARQ